MNGEFDLSRDVAEKVLKRAMTPVRELLQDVAVDKSEWGDDELVSIALGKVKELDRDLGVLGLTLATRYSEQVEYQTALGVLSAENVRLHTVVAALAELSEKYRAEIGSLIGELSKARNVNDKLKEVTTRGFQASVL